MSLLHEGMFEGLSIGSYLLLVDYTGRLFREGKARISAELTGILDRIGSTAESWQHRIEKLTNGRWFGRFFAASGHRLSEMATRFSVRRVLNLAGWRLRESHAKPQKITQKRPSAI